MSIVVFWLEPAAEADPALASALQARARSFDSGALGEALAHCEQLRRAGMRHVTISSELEESATLPGVSDVLPRDYDWKKRRE